MQRRMEGAKAADETSGAVRVDDTGMLPDTKAAYVESIERYRSLFVYSPHAAFSVDLNGVFTDANQETQQRSGYSLAELELLDFTQLLIPEHRERVLLAHEGVLRGESQRLEATVCTKDGQHLEVNLVSVPVIVGGHVVGVHVTAEDITERNELRRDLERHRRVAEQANAAKSLFVANMSHEVRTPLTSVLGATELLAEGELDSEQRGFVEMIHRSGERLLRLVNDILDVSRLEAGKVELERVPFSLHTLVKDAVEWMGPLAAGNGIGFTSSLDPSLPDRLDGDSMRITQVLTNLLGNALKFTEQGQVRLRVETVSTHPVLQVRFVVQDSGIGISENELGTLFESFAQADTSTTRSHGGAGLGLAISQELVTLMGGALTATSTPGRGSSFVFTLPLSGPPA